MACFVHGASFLLAHEHSTLEMIGLSLGAPHSFTRQVVLLATITPRQVYGMVPSLWTCNMENWEGHSHLPSPCVNGSLKAVLPSFYKRRQWEWISHDLPEVMSSECGKQGPTRICLSLECMPSSKNLFMKRGMVRGAGGDHVKPGILGFSLQNMWGCIN